MGSAMPIYLSKRASEQKYALLQSVKINQDIENSYNRKKAILKLLLLGAGESGKSTVLRQIKMMYSHPLTSEERKRLDFVIHRNILEGMKTLVEQFFARLSTESVTNQDHLRKCSEISLDHPIDEEVGQMIKELWAEPAIKNVWESRNEFQIGESSAYFFDRIDTIMQPDYVPSQQDLLFARFRSSGVRRERLTISNHMFELYDVGGQRNERRKWIHCFDNVTAVIFIAAISEYNQNLYEDSSKNRVIEAIELFSDICNSTFFRTSSMILFLNKIDLFKEKVKKHPIKSVDHFDDFSGKIGDVDAGVEYFLNRFTSVNRDSNKQIFHHITCATDTDNIKTVFDFCRSTIIRNSLLNSGLMLGTES
mmetsp:Transcript_3939/g.5479  ORF Transcript_3939/g.5479 Transcript_3939/m.5479 type:complete len:365 (+) Transcript_3939:108-1202(+)